MISAVGSTMISAPRTPLIPATRSRVSLTWVTGSPESTRTATPLMINCFLVAVNGVGRRRRRALDFLRRRPRDIHGLWMMLLLAGGHDALGPGVGGSARVGRLGFG
jgi:hypothetical protein